MHVPPYVKGKTCTHLYLPLFLHTTPGSSLAFFPSPTCYWIQLRSVCWGRNFIRFYDICSFVWAFSMKISSLIFSLICFWFFAMVFLIFSILILFCKGNLGGRDCRDCPCRSIYFWQNYHPIRVIIMNKRLINFKRLAF